MINKLCEEEYIRKMCIRDRYTNGCDGYLPTSSEYDRGGYEVLHSYLLYYIYYGVVMPLNRDSADILIKIVSNQWKKIKL